jgi:branched-chain amino acid transport system ATP-binding protein
MMELVNVSKHFGSLRAVNGISLYIDEGEIRGLIGPNGSGKTTLFNLITGYIKPTCGRIMWKGQNIAGCSPHSVARKGIVRTFQLTSIYRELTVLEHVIMGCHLLRRLNPIAHLLGSKSVRQETDAMETTARRWIEFMGLRKHESKHAGELPGGTQKVVAIATALAAGPKLLLLDEPIAGLNTAEKSQVIEKVNAIRQLGISILLVEHDMKTIMTTCDTITVIDFGAKIAEGSPEVVSRDQRTIEAYLGKRGSGVTNGQ